VVVIEAGEDAAAAARADGARVIQGNAADPEVLAEADLAGARAAVTTAERQIDQQDAVLAQMQACMAAVARVLRVSLERTLLTVAMARTASSSSTVSSRRLTWTLKAERQCGPSSTAARW
jgi:voltage-gated potassium channel Kch